MELSLLSICLGMVNTKSPKNALSGEQIYYMNPSFRNYHRYGHENPMGDAAILNNNAI
jgi:hypothetical protein